MHTRNTVGISIPTCRQATSLAAIKIHTKNKLTFTSQLHTAPTTQCTIIISSHPPPKFTSSVYVPPSPSYTACHPTLSQLHSSLSQSHDRSLSQLHSSLSQSHDRSLSQLHGSLSQLHGSLSHLVRLSVLPLLSRGVSCRLSLLLFLFLLLLAVLLFLLFLLIVSLGGLLVVLLRLVRFLTLADRVRLGGRRAARGSELMLQPPTQVRRGPVGGGNPFQPTLCQLCSSVGRLPVPRARVRAVFSQ